MLRQIVYVRDEDAENDDVKEAVLDISGIFAINFLSPSTATNIEVLSVTEFENLKFLPLIISGKPNFVDRVFIVNMVCEFDQESTQTSCNLPMITINNVNDKAYFFTVFVEETNGSTEVKMYPQLPEWLP
ncbi:hypothetical protein [Pseudothermotoga thermarum]|uniref:Uncharacterized protein n=1 Tax=Pseudothermotoga thermarum DSM 5069 TaxID=688269 RepID=F7YYQ0_9THEM|nr:hypothetical protein [Pseudothermotoga thermarum]AEH51083.1 hypothetical protein Theth_1002 [Pseudothermotoga thermarum DSM 5069]